MKKKWKTKHPLLIVILDMLQLSNVMSSSVEIIMGKTVGEKAF
jgi:hypothetical protein